MKRECVEPQQHHQFSKLQPFSPHSLQLIPPTDSELETLNPNQSEPTHDGPTIEVTRRPRGRPPGSKNKPKPPVIITREPNQPTMSPYILEIPSANDLLETISLFSRRRNLGVCVLSGSGAVSNVTLRQPSAASTITFHGRFEILSISATFLPSQNLSSSPSSSSSFRVPNNFSISLAGPQGQIVGGIVAGRLVAAGTVFVVAASFSNPSFHRLPAELEEGVNGNSKNGSCSVSGSGDGHSPGVSVSGSRGEGVDHQGGGGGLYSCHLGGGPDVIWASAARPPY